MGGEKSKTILVVVDGFDYAYIHTHLAELEWFRELDAAGRLAPLASVVPADSLPAWTTIYTGKNPAEHGVIESVDYLNLKGLADAAGDDGAAAFRGITFWDELGRRGKKVCVFNPFMAYPAWAVNGLMVCGPVFEGGAPATNRPDLVDMAQLPPLGGLVGHPTTAQMAQFLEDNLALTQRQFDAFEQVFQTDRYDFAFLGILTADRLQHFLWKYADPADRCHKKGNPLQGAVLRTYRLIQQNLRTLEQRYGDEYNLVVISDHGHGRRCQRTFYVNRWLIDQGLVPDRSRKNRLTEYAKNTLLRTMAAAGWVERGTRMLKRFRFAHRVKNADYAFKKTGRVYAPRFDGCNPFGGICVDREAFDTEAEYEAIRQRIIDGLLRVRNGEKPVVEWATRREEIYRGDKVGNYPEIVYHLDSDYGVDRGLYGRRLFGINAMHEIISGGHRFHGVILGNRDDVRDVGSVLNLYRYILGVAGGPGPAREGGAP